LPVNSEFEAFSYYANIKDITKTLHQAA